MSEGLKLFEEKLKDEAFLEELKKTGSIEELKIHIRKMPELTDEDVEFIFSQRDGELAEDVLEKVAGGCGEYDDYNVWTEFWKVVTGWF